MYPRKTTTSDHNVTGNLFNASSPMNHKQKHTHTQPFNGPLSGTTRVSQYQKGKTNLDFTEARDGEWQWHQLRQHLTTQFLPCDAMHPQY